MMTAELVATDTGTHTLSQIDPRTIRLTKQVDLEKFQADPEGYLRGVATFAVQGLVSRCAVCLFICLLGKGLGLAG